MRTLLRPCVASVASLLLAVAALASANFWEEKDYHRWSAKECTQLLTNSPWAKRTGITQVASGLIGMGDSGPSNRQRTTISQSTSIAPQDEVTSGRAASNQLSYVVQFRSALPLRMALVRDRLLAVNIDSQSPENKKAYEEQAEQFVAAPLGDVVLVHVIYYTNVERWDRDLANYWQHQTLDTVRNSFFLIGSHGRVAPVAYQASQGNGRDFEVSFPRATADGEPLASPTDKTIAVEFNHPAVGVRESRMFVEFKVKDMVQGGKVIY